jgi:hypothetical protein
MARRRRNKTPAPEQDGSHQCAYREVLEHLIAWLYGQDALTVDKSTVLRLIGAAEPDRLADPVTGCLPVTAEGPQPRG